MEKTSELLTEFYRGREVLSSAKLIIDENAEGDFRIHNGGKDYNLNLENLTEEQRENLGKRLVKYQEEMRYFTAFLRKKYFCE